jgi:hypothetical protein
MHAAILAIWLAAPGRLIVIVSSLLSHSASIFLVLLTTKSLKNARSWLLASSQLAHERNHKLFKVALKGTAKSSYIVHYYNYHAPKLSVTHNKNTINITKGRYVFTTAPVLVNFPWKKNQTPIDIML